MADDGFMDRNLALEVVRVTEAAALAASRLMGRGDEMAADQAAVNAMRDPSGDQCGKISSPRSAIRRTSPLSRSMMLISDASPSASTNAS